MPYRILSLTRVFALCLMIQAVGCSFSSASNFSDKKVRLLFPIENGTELTLLERFVNSPKLYSADGKTFVLAAELPDAVVAFRLGKTIQSKLKLAFILAYDSGHPQSDLKWMQAEINSNKRLAQVVQNDKKNRQVSGFGLERPMSINPSATRQAITKLSALSPKASVLYKPSDCVPVSKCLSSIKIFNPLFSALPAVGSFKPLEDAPIQTSSSKANLFASVTKPIDPQAVEGTKLQIPASNRPNLGLSTKPNQQDHPPESSKFAFSIKKQSPLPASSDWPVEGNFMALTPHAESVAISPVSSFTYSDPALVYVFVRVTNKDQVSFLIKDKNPQAYYRVKESLYAQLAVYNSSRLGRQALDVGLNTLMEQGLNPIAFTPRQFLTLAS